MRGRCVLVVKTHTGHQIDIQIVTSISPIYLYLFRDKLSEGWEEVIRDTGSIRAL